MTPPIAGMAGHARRNIASTRRTLLAGAAGTACAAGVAGAAGVTALAGRHLAAGGRAPAWHGTDVSASLPPLRFVMTDAATGQRTDAQAFRGKIVLLTFGYSSCPDACPLTLANLARVLRDLGDAADGLRALFVTVDPVRDTLPVLRDYTAQFAPQIVGLRGGADALATLARRYRVAYSVTPAMDGAAYEVTHSSLVYAFDRDGAARLIFASLATAAPDLAGMAADLRRLLAAPRQDFWARLAPLA